MASVQVLSTHDDGQVMSFRASRLSVSSALVLRQRIENQLVVRIETERRQNLLQILDCGTQGRVNNQFKRIRSNGTSPQISRNGTNLTGVNDSRHSFQRKRFNNNFHRLHAINCDTEAQYTGFNFQVHVSWVLRKGQLFNQNAHQMTNSIRNHLHDARNSQLNLHQAQITVKRLIAIILAMTKDRNQARNVQGALQRRRMNCNFRKLASFQGLAGLECFPGHSFNASLEGVKESQKHGQGKRRVDAMTLTNGGSHLEFACVYQRQDILGVLLALLGVL